MENIQAPWDFPIPKRTNRESVVHSENQENVPVVLKAASASKQSSKQANT